MRKAIVYLIITVTFQGFAFGQEKTVPEKFQLPPETIEVHLTQTCYFPGEALAFTIYCTNPLFPELELSQAAYIEVVSEQNTSVLRKKILLEKGAGCGAFRLPEEIPTGIYTVMVYTRWLKNFGEASFHRQHIVILNPDQQIPLATDTAGVSPNPLTGSCSDQTSPQAIELHPAKTDYDHREKVTVTVLLKQEEGGYPAGGYFSVSAHLSEPSLYQKKNEETRSRDGITEEEIEYLPDFNGMVLTGKLENATGVTLHGTRIILSEPGHGTNIYTATTEIDGVFHFLLPAREGEADLVFTLPEEEAVISLNEPYWNGFRNPPFQSKLNIHPADAASLEMRYSHFQIKQRLNLPDFSIDSEPDQENENRENFYTHPGRTFKIEDYIQLDSLPEYFYELIPSVQFIQNRGRSEIRVVDPVTFEILGEQPGVFLDGVLYPDYREITRIPVANFDRITILPEVYHYHDLTFGGIVDIHTTGSDFNGVRLLPNMARLIYPMTSKSELKYEPRDYSESGNSEKSPDLRHLICWDTNVMIDDSGKKEIQFYTGDVPGEYTIKVTGITSGGKIVRSETRINVGQE